MTTLGVIPANIPHGYWKYEGIDQLPFGRGKGDIFQTACIVEQTLGDRRLHSHLLSGIFLLLNKIVDANAISRENVLALFPKSRPKVDDCSNYPESTANFIGDAMLLTSYKFIGSDADICKAKNFGYVWSVPRDRNSIANAIHFDFHEKSPLDIPDTQWSTLLHSSDEEEEIPMDSRWNKKWAEISSRLDNKLKEMKLKSNSRSVLPYLFSRLGYDCGRFMSVLHNRCKTSWGTYQDSLCHEGQWHCNAHSNNMVVLDPRNVANEMANEHHAFLGYLDLDMAFTQDEYVNLKHGGTVGIPDGTTVEKFDELLDYENINFQSTLTGLSNSSGLRAPAILKNEEQCWKHENIDVLKLLRIALYDTMVLSYKEAYVEVKTSIKKEEERSKETNNYSYAYAKYDHELHDIANDIIWL